MMSGFKQVKFGALLSYVLMILNMVYGLWLTPFLIGRLGADEYGLYKLVGSLSSALLVLNLGIGDTVQRYVSLYRARNEDEKTPNLMAMCLIISVLLNVLIIIVGLVIVIIFPTVYSNTLSVSQLSKARVLLIILIINLTVTVIENLFSGLLMGYNNFVFHNVMKIIVIIIRAISIYTTINFGGDSISLASISLATGIFLLIAEYVYVKIRIRIKIRLEKWDKSLFKEASKYTLLMFLTALASQAFTNVDNIVIGAFLGTAVVSIYSVGQYFFNLFQQLSCGVSGVMLPTITNVLHKEGGIKEAERVVIKAGRVQFMLLGAALAGIICIGKEFIFLWLGEGFDDVYILTLILVTPTLFELCTNVCLSILRAQNKITFRTYVNFISAVLNAILTVILVKYWSYIGAAVATAISYIVCSLIATNLYYIKVIKLDMLNIYKGIISRIWLSILVPSIILLIVKRFLDVSWMTFILEVLIFCIIYFVMLIKYGLDNDEIKQIPFVCKIFPKKIQ